MAKQTFQDIVPPEPEKSIRKIPLSKDRLERKSAEDEGTNRDRLARTLAGGWRGVRTDTDKKRFTRKTKIFGLAGILLLTVLFFAIFGRGSADVKIIAKQLSHNFDIEIEALKEGEGATFEILEITKEAEKIVPARGEEMVERKATGEIIIYNRHSTNPQTLIRNTRFETSAGLIYRIEDGITVPGMTERGGEAIPGQIKVRVYADEPGERYNIDLADFTIPGFKGLPQYENFFARSATPMAGGFVGRVKKVDEETLKQTRAELQDALEKTLLGLAIESSESDFVLLTESLQTSFFPLTEEGGSANDVKIKERGELSGIILDRSKLEKIMIKSVLGEANEEIRIRNPEKLVYQIKEPEDFSNLNNINTLVLNVNGRTDLVWQINHEKIQNDLAGKRKSEVSSILSKHGAVGEADASIDPFWKRSFPINPEKIKIEVVDKI